MNKQLFPRMFCGHTRDRNTSFNLSSGQIIGKPSRVSAKGDWYNQYGHWLGCGDLSATNIRHIAQSLSPRSVFIVLSERHDAEFVNDRPTGWRKSGMYVAHKCDILIVKHNWFVVSDSLAKTSGFLNLSLARLCCKVIDRARARRMIADADSGKLRIPAPSPEGAMMTA